MQQNLYQILPHTQRINNLYTNQERRLSIANLETHQKATKEQARLRFESIFSQYQRSFILPHEEAKERLRLVVMRKKNCNPQSIVSPRGRDGDLKDSILNEARLEVAREKTNFGHMRVNRSVDLSSAYSEKREVNHHFKSVVYRMLKDKLRILNLVKKVGAEKEKLSGSPAVEELKKKKSLNSSPKTITLNCSTGSPCNYSHLSNSRHKCSRTLSISGYSAIVKKLEEFGKAMVLSCIDYLLHEGPIIYHRHLHALRAQVLSIK